MKDHCYWPLVSDLNNVLSHPSIAYQFMEDEKQLTMWFDFLPMFQVMNNNLSTIKWGGFYDKLGAEVGTENPINGALATFIDILS